MCWPFLEARQIGIIENYTYTYIQKKKREKLDTKKKCGEDRATIWTPAIRAAWWLYALA